MVLNLISVLLLYLSKVLNDDLYMAGIGLFGFCPKTHNRGWDEHVKK